MKELVIRECDVSPRNEECQLSLQTSASGSCILESLVDCQLVRLDFGLITFEVCLVLNGDKYNIFYVTIPHKNNTWLQCVCCSTEICILYDLFQPRQQSFVSALFVGTKRCKRPCLYYGNSTAAFHLLLISDLVFKMNPGPGLVGKCPIKPIISVQTSRPLLPTLQQNENNLIKINCLSAIRNVEHQLSICFFNARSVRNKSADIMDYICDTKVDIIAIIIY